MSTEAETYITSVVFNEEALEITYLEGREQTPTVMMARTMVFALDDPEKEAILYQVQELLNDLIDRAFHDMKQVNRQSEREAQKATWEQLSLEGSRDE